VASKRATGLRVPLCVRSLQVVGIDFGLWVDQVIVGVRAWVGFALVVVVWICACWFVGSFVRLGQFGVRHAAGNEQGEGSEEAS